MPVYATAAWRASLFQDERDRLFSSAASPDMIIHMRTLDPGRLAYFRKRPFFALVNQATVASLIAALLLLRGPADVARLIIAVHVNSVEAVIRRWLRSDVVKKGLEGIRPTLANGNAAPAV